MGARDYSGEPAAAAARKQIFHAGKKRDTRKVVCFGWFVLVGARNAVLLRTRRAVLFWLDN